MARSQYAAAFLAVLTSALVAHGQSVNRPAPNGDHVPPNRTYHVNNYRLALHFDFAKGEIFGDDIVTLRPIGPGLHRFYLNSSGLTISSVTLLRADSTPLPLTFSRSDPRLWIQLDRAYGPADVVRVRIVYHGIPRTGLFFVNPDRDYPHWPREVYSQGEPELNHFWFPCWDYPNDMATSETIITVPAGLTAVSNGKLLKVTHAANESTFDWVESIPHSSYLTSIAAGPWRKVTDRYEDKAVDYYVPEYVSAARARRSFHLTPDMIGFFSRATGVDYPYEKYAQVTVHNFIFGGQENVSATTLTDDTLHDARADHDYSSTVLVDHELGQHWFGDYVQGRDWADIWLNEGFATYMEALYAQHHHGYDAYRYAIYEDQLDEQAEQRSGSPRPIIYSGYADPLDMFGATTHEKGAAVLDMLRFVVDGAVAARQPASQNEVLFRALHQYLVNYHGHAVDTHNLVQVLHKSTDLDLGWFFREWVYMVGHPDYHVEASFNTEKKAETLTISQTQHVDAVTPLFTMPIEVEFHGANGESQGVVIRDDKQGQTVTVPLDFQPQWVDFDPDDYLDKTLVFDQPTGALIAAAEHDSAMMSRLWAVQQLGAGRGDAGIEVAALQRVLETDSFYAVRVAAASSLAKIGGSQAQAAMLAALDPAEQPDSRVRAAVVHALRHFSKSPAVYDALVRSLRNDSSYAVEAADVSAIGRSGNSGAFAVLQAEAGSAPEIHVMQAALSALAASRDPRSAAILFAEAQPGRPERVRMAALAALTALPQDLVRTHMPELAVTVRAAVSDPYLLVRQGGERLAGEFHLTQFTSAIQADATAPLVIQSRLARQILAQLQHPQPGSNP